MLVGKNLHFDVARVGDGFLEIDLVAAKCALSLASRRIKA